MKRLAVKYGKQVLMPMKAARVRKFVESGRGKIRYDRKIGIHYLQLLAAPSGNEVQPIVIGLDPGSTFDGLSVVSSKCHHENIELIQRPKKGKTAIKTFKTRQAAARRVRRSRLRHRKIRFSNRTSKKIAPTIRANIEFRQWAIKKLIELYPISKVCIEDVRFNHYKSTKGKSFSHVEQGKTYLYRWVKSLGLELELFDGWQTKQLRLAFFGVDIKSSDKGDRAFAAHCVDSFVLACNKENVVDTDTGEIHLDQWIITNQLIVKRKVTFIEKIVKVRRRLTMTRAKFKDKSRYYRLLPGGEKEYYDNYSNKRNVCRVQSEGEHSNHPKEWIYIKNEKSMRAKQFNQGYGGTRINGKSFLKNGEWQNRILSKSDIGVEQ